jgi:hypothetical protein
MTSAGTKILNAAIELPARPPALPHALFRSSVRMLEASCSVSLRRRLWTPTTMVQFLRFLAAAAALCSSNVLGTFIPMTEDCIKGVTFVGTPKGVTHRVPHRITS